MARQHDSNRYDLTDAEKRDRPTDLIQFSTNAEGVVLIIE
jgi:hypothetical protein